MSFESIRSNCFQLNSDLQGLFALVKAAPGFFSERITVHRAEEEIKRDLVHRERRFLELARTKIYNCPESPYLKLLKLAGCEFSDLQTQVLRCGVEETLKRLARVGVYLTADEFKGKKGVVRGRQSFRVAPSCFDLSDLSAGYRTQSSGTTNQPIRSFVSLNWLVTSAILRSVFYSAHDLFSFSHATYDAILPATGGVSNLLVNAKLGIRSDRWFARKIPVNGMFETTYHLLVTYFIVLLGKWFGPGLPRPQFTSTMEVGDIVSWILTKKREGRACCVRTTASNAVRVAREARIMSASLEGTKFIVSGEPFTESKRDTIARVGASATTFYGSGSGSVGYGCANPMHADEIHVFHHRIGVIAHPEPRRVAGVSIHPLLFTSLHPTSSRLLLNVENGDYATLEKRDCGCALERVGLKLHLHHIRSYEKFTSEGMNYSYGDLFELFEKVFPAEFGGGPGDYQLVEEEDEQGQTRLSLLVNPAVGELNEEKLLAHLRAALAQGSRGNRFVTELWQDAETFRVVRKPPYASARGKILPLHISRGENVSP
jgi:hypothetical protein